jgi:hypothetical protein
MTEVNVYMSSTAAEAFENRVRSYPVGSVIVKEKLPGSNIGGMVKRRAGYDPEHGDWEYFFKDEQGITSGRIESCVRCHDSARPRDYVFGDWSKGATSSKATAVQRKQRTVMSPE